MKILRILFLSSALMMMVPACAGSAEEAASETEEVRTDVAEDASDDLDEAEETSGDALGGDLSDEGVDQLLND
jgi:hypothetical protein